MNHDEITRIITADHTIPYGVGICPNPFASRQNEWERRRVHAGVLQAITSKIESLFEPRFITPPETSECIESIVTMTDSRQILELGTCTGFTSLHILRAIYGKDGAKLVSVDARPAHDRNWWKQKEFVGVLEFLEGWTPQVLEKLAGQQFDLVFVDSDHSVDHTRKEMDALWPITHKGTIFLFHDLPEWQSPRNHSPFPVRDLIWQWVRDGKFSGLILPTAEQLDCLEDWGAGYPKQCNPHLGVFMRSA